MLCALPGLWSCGVPNNIFEPGDRAPGYYINTDSIPDAVPRNEPLSRRGNPFSYYVMGKRYYVMKSNAGYVERGIASWYGAKFHGRKTSSGEIYDTYGMTAAHKTLPLPTYARVTNLRNHKSVVVKINDRGPFIDDRLIDLSYAAAKKLGITKKGTAYVEIQAINTRKPESHQARDHSISTPTMKSEHSAITHDADTPSALEDSDEKPLYIQVAAFQDQDNAKRLRYRLEQIPLSKINILKNTQDQKTIYRVRIGPVANMDLANKLTDKLHQHGLSGVRIISD